MWARTQLKIGWCDLLFGAAASLSGRNREALQSQIEAYWSPSGDTIACYSVRSGFDLLLQALDLNSGDEIIFSALNVKGMVKIARRLDLVAVPADLDIAHFGPRLETLEAALSPKSKVLIVAHLFGSILDMGPIVEFARKHNLILVEDCAQVFDGHAYLGHEKSDVRLFSFGPLKTATALGGALIRVQDKAVLGKMVALQKDYPVQGRKDQLSRVVKFSILKLALSRPVMKLIYHGFKAFGLDYQDALSDKVRGVAKLGSSQKLRFQPGVSMMSLLARRLNNFQQGALNDRTQVAERLRDLIGDAVVLPAQANQRHSYWVFPLIVDDPQAFILRLRAQGFDCADLPRSQAVEAPEDRPELEAIVASTALSDLVIVPCYPGMPDAELVRLAAAVVEIAQDVGAKRTKTYAKTLKPATTAA